MSPIHQLAPAGAAGYFALSVLGLALGTFFWLRRTRDDPRLAAVLIAAIAGAYLGAKIVFLIAEGWLYFGQEEAWRIWLAGKSILGALLGGFAAVEGMKSLVKYERTTGDLFAAVLPPAMILGRLGCVAGGCCGGLSVRLGGWSGIWPSVGFEMGFQVLCIPVFWGLRRRHLLTGQHFHLYLIAYGFVRFFNEFGRATPKVLWETFSGYQVGALILIAVGVLAFRKRQRQVYSGSGSGS